MTKIGLRHRLGSSLTLPTLVAAVLLGIAACEENEGSTGLFLIVAEAQSRDELPDPGQEQQILLHDYRFLRPEERQPAKYFLLPKEPDVRLLLAREPQLVEGDRGFKELLIELSEEAAADMERVTRENVGRKAAFLIDGEVVTAHKIRTPIKGGRFQLSRCTDNACESILARLQTR